MRWGWSSVDTRKPTAETQGRRDFVPQTARASRTQTCVFRSAYSPSSIRSMPHPAGPCFCLPALSSHRIGHCAAREEKPVGGESKPVEVRILEHLIAQIAVSTRSASSRRESFRQNFKAAGYCTGRATAAQFPIFRRQATPSFRESGFSDGRRRALKRFSIGDLGLPI